MDAPALVYDDVVNTVTGLDGTYEYKIGSFAWTAGNVVGDFSGAVTVQVRVKATATTLASLIQTITFTANLSLSGVTVDVLGGKINGTSTLMQYSLNSTNGLDGTWTDCSGTSVTVSFNTAQNVCVRAKAQIQNFRIVKASASAPVVTAAGSANAKALTGASTLMEYSRDGGTTWSPITAAIAAGATIDVSNAPNNDLRVRIKATSSNLPSLATGCLNSLVVFTTLSINVTTNTISGTTNAMEYSVNSTTGINGTWTVCTSPATIVSGFAAGKVYVRAKTQGTNYTLLATIAAQGGMPDATLSNTPTTEGKTRLIMLDATKTYQYIVDSSPTLTGTAAAWASAQEVSVATEVDDLAVDSTQYVHIRVKGSASQLPSAIRNIDVQITDIKPATAPDVEVNDPVSSSAYIQWTSAGRIQTTDALEYSLDGSPWADVLDATSLNLVGTHTIYVRVKATTALPASDLKVITDGT